MAFKGDATLRSAGEKIEYTPELLNEFVKAKEDIIYFAEKYFKIITIDEGEITIKLWEFQKRMLKAYFDPSPKRHVCILSARQCGKCFSKSINITVRNKKTGKVEKIPIEQFYLKFKESIDEKNKKSM